MRKIVLIDGLSIVNRAFYGLPDMTNSEGLHTNAIFGFLNIMFKMIEEEKPDYLSVAFDVSAPTFRHEMYADYKGTRKPFPDDLREQIPVLKDLLVAMNVHIIEQAGLEADDILGTISRICEEQDMKVTIVSGDRDTLQLASEQVKIRVPKTSKGKTEIYDYNAKDVEAEYGVTPSEFIDIKALQGDASDNIPGVPGIGEKTAKNIIMQYRSIEAAYEHAYALKPPRASKNIVEYWEQAKLSKVLATIERFGEIEFILEDSVYENPYTDEAFEFFKELQFKQYLNRFESPKVDGNIEDTFVRIESPMDLAHVLQEAKKAKHLALSLVEANHLALPLFASNSGYCGYSFCFSNDKVYQVIEQTGLSMEEINEQITNLIQAIHQNPDATVICFDVKLMCGQVDGLEVKSSFDAHIAAFLLNPLKNDYEIHDIALEYLNVQMDAKLEAEIKSLYEAYVLYRSHPMLSAKLSAQEMMELYTEIEMPLVFTIHEMEQVGVKIQAEELKAYGDRLAIRIDELIQEIYQDAGQEFNISSPKQLGEILFEKLKLPTGKKTKTGYSTAVDVLESLVANFPEEAKIVTKILEYRQLTKLKSTYADGLANYIAKDGRIHGKFNQTVAATGRLSSTEPNLQNIPIRMELGRLIRKVFIPEENHIFLDADYSQIELRILAHFSGDEHLMSAYIDELDIHRLTASQVFHTPFEDVTETQRRNAKAVNFGIVYGQSAFGLAQELGISRGEAGQYIEQYFATYPNVKKFLDDAVKQAKEHGYVTTMFHRRRPIPELTSSNFQTRSFGERVAMNAPIQGTAADIMKIAMIRVVQEIKERGLQSRMILTVHDELLVETHLDEVDVVTELLQRNMEEAAELRVPLVAEVHSGSNWYDAK